MGTWSSPNITITTTPEKTEKQKILYRSKELFSEFYRDLLACAFQELLEKGCVNDAPMTPKELATYASDFAEAAVSAQLKYEAKVEGLAILSDVDLGQ